MQTSIDPISDEDASDDEHREAHDTSEEANPLPPGHEIERVEDI